MVINLSFLHSCYQFICCKINIHYFISNLQNFIRHSFLHFNSGNFSYIFINAFYVLYVNCRYYINACIQNIQYILPAFFIFTAGNIRMCQFINNHNIRM